jgi:hypothetical protein
VTPTALRPSKTDVGRAGGRPLTNRRGGQRRRRTPPARRTSCRCRRLLAPGPRSAAAARGRPLPGQRQAANASKLTTPKPRSASPASQLASAGSRVPWWPSRPGCARCPTRSRRRTWRLVLLRHRRVRPVRHPRRAAPALQGRCPSIVLRVLEPLAGLGEVDATAPARASAAYRLKDVVAAPAGTSEGASEWM